jgi:diguanylate cyclase (GGDEF)-like protein/PAS domain S-box-containing protein
MYRPRNDPAPLSSAFLKLPDTLLLVFDKEGRLKMISDAWVEALGYDLGELEQHCFFDLLYEDDRVECRERLEKMCEEAPTQRFSSRCYRKEGGYLGVVWNLSLEVESGLFFASAHETAVHLSPEEPHLPDVFVDGLTGLPNRSLFLDRLEHTFRRAARRKDMQFAVLHCGIDRFKVINHSLGHRMGDLLLTSVANLIRNTIRPTDMVARLAGDEFGILLEDIRDVSSTLHVVTRILQKLQLPFMLHNHEVFSTISFGIVVNADEYQLPDAMLRDANLAMVGAKQMGGGAYMVFNKGMHDQAVRRMELEMDLRHALERGEFQAYYQPIINLEHSTLAGFEALVRWNHPEKGLISPVEFIPVAEETGLIVALGRWMLQESCRQLKHWHTTLPDAEHLTVSVNLSCKQVLNARLLDDVQDALTSSGLSARSLKVEITESAMMQDTERAIVLLEQLQAMGIRILLDDFGTGYSSLAYLHRLPINTLKVDRSFVRHLHEKNTDRHFVETIVHLAQRLQQDVICEGVELQEQADILAAMGVGYIQGFLYSRPVAAHEAEMLILTGFPPKN